MPQPTNPPVLYIEGEEDNQEMLSELESSTEDEISKEDNKYAEKVPPRIQKLRDIRKKSQVSFSQGIRFLANVELDIKRKNENSLLIEDLYIHWCKNGNKTWLSPGEIISKYEEVLLLYNGKRNVISPFIKELIAIAEQGISPHAFLRYVINPRMGNDFNWREWGAKHLNPIKIIAQILLQLKQASPFDKEILGTSNVRIARDICLVKYVGKPLARFSEEALKNKNQIDQYISYWANLKLDNTFFLTFLKRNVLPILYALSGKVDLQHLNRILIFLPDVEELFKSNFPEGFLDSTIKTPPMIYGKDFEKGFEERRNKGYKYYDFVVETESFLEILKALLGTTSGYFLMPWFSGILIGRKDAQLASRIAQLVSAIRDDGGKYIYTWHTRKLLSKPPTERDIYIELVRSNNGVDPTYPNIQNLFTHPEEASENEYIIQLANKLGIPLSELGPSNYRYSFRDLIKAYIKRNPSSEKILEKFRIDICNGNDKNWNNANISEFDSLGNTVHPMLLRSAIKGMGMNFSSGIKAPNLSMLYATFPVIKAKPLLVETEFKIPTHEIKSLDKFKEEEIKKKVNIQIILSAISPFMEEALVSEDNFIPFLNKEFVQLREPEEAKAEEKRKLELEINNLETSESKDNDEIKKTKELLKKADKALKFISDKRKHYENILNNFPLLSITEKFITTLLIASSITETGSDLYSFVISLLLNRYQKDLRLSEQLKFLREDIVPETLNFNQVNYFLNTLEQCKALLQNDKEIEKIQIDSRSKLHELLMPYIIIKNKKLTLESIDAAINKLASTGKLNSEKSKWQDILENTEKKLERDFSSYKLFISKTSVDAYYGDMGGICLANYPGEIKKDGFYVIRLLNKEQGIINGMSLAVLTSGGIPSLGFKTYWAAFAFNPLSSLISSYSSRNQLYFYLHYRKELEKLSESTKIPIVLVGVDTYGILSNNSNFRDIILKYEERKEIRAKKISDANGISLYYDEKSYRQAMLIIDPSDKKTFTADSYIQKYRY